MKYLEYPKLVYGENGIGKIVLDEKEEELFYKNHGKEVKVVYDEDKDEVKPVKDTKTKKK